MAVQSWIWIAVAALILTPFMLLHTYRDPNKEFAVLSTSIQKNGKEQQEHFDIIQRLLSTLTEQNENLATQGELLAKQSKQLAQQAEQLAQQGEQLLSGQAHAIAVNEADKIKSVPSYLLAERELPTRRNVFFDLGANIGDSTLQFSGIEKTSMVGGELSNQLYAIPKRVPGVWDVRVYEAHPKFDNQLIETKRRVEALDSTEYGGPFHVYLFNTTAIGFVEGTIDFFLDVKSGVTWGSSLLDVHPDVNKSAPGAVLKVPVHDLPTEIMKYRISDYVVVKMDIEGIEMDLLLEMLIRGAFPYIDELYVEFHPFANKNKEWECLQNNVLQYAKKYMHVGKWQ